jgi:RND family efflux transporter MFP subunit
MMTNKRKLMILAIVIAVSVGGYFFFKSRQPVIEYTTVAATRGDLVQTVSEVGTIKAKKELDLNFARTGQVNKILVKVGDQVKKDQPLMELDYSALLLNQKEAQSALDVALANQQKLIAGSTATDIAVMQAQVNQAQVNYNGGLDNLQKIKQTLQVSLNQADKKLADLQDSTPATVTPLEQAVAGAKNSLSTTIDYKLSVTNNALDNIDRILKDEGAQNSLSVKNSAYLVLTRNDLATAQASLDAATADLDRAKNDASDANLKMASASALTALSQAYTALNDCYSVLENSVASASFTQATLDSFKTTISSQQTAVNTGMGALQTALDALNQTQVNLSDGLVAASNAVNSAQTAMDQQTASAQNSAAAAKQALDVAQSQLAKLKSFARPEDVALSAAQIRQAQASLDLIASQINDNIIKAPIDGQVTNINYEIGEQFTAAKPALTLLTENNFEIEADVSESDISKVKIGDQVSVTLDAFGEGVKLAGAVESIDPAATIIQDVIYYKVKVLLTPDASTTGIKPGMTANIIITTDRRSNALIIPARAVVQQGNRYVRVLENNKVREVTVTLGLAGDDGLVEVLTGDLKPNDQVVTFIKDPNQK